jgi:hypothetical protein
MTAKQLPSHVLNVELGAGPDGGPPTEVRFTDVVRPAEGEEGEPTLVAMVIMPIDVWRKAGAPAQISIEPVAFG